MTVILLLAAGVFLYFSLTILNDALLLFRWGFIFDERRRNLHGLALLNFMLASIGFSTVFAILYYLFVWRY
jgi:hypothetical protein